MNVRVNREGGKIGLIIVLIVFAVPILGALFSLGSFLLGTAGVEYFKEKKNARKYTEEVTAVVVDVDRDYKGSTLISYQTVSYEYNGQKYESKIEYSVEASGHYSSDGKGPDEDSIKDSEENREEHWDELQDTIGKEEKIYIDPKDPSKAAGHSEDKVIHALGVMTLIGALVFLVFIILIVVFIIILKHVYKKTVDTVNNEIQYQQQQWTDNSVSEEDWRNQD